ncbi:hypothetical protein PAZH1_74 [Pseudomonas phage PA_ZH1]|nr:hypothetical protein PAZH1_74 [Pseudomonas phage PA_ZH1]
MHDLVIYWKAHDGYYIQDEYGEHPVTFQFAEINWNFTGAYVYGGSELIDDHLRFGIDFKVRDIEWQIRFDLDGKFTLYNMSNNDRDDTFVIPVTSKFAQFFKKTGKHVVTNEVITIPVNCSFDKQIY